MFILSSYKYIGLNIPKNAAQRDNFISDVQKIKKYCRLIAITTKLVNDLKIKKYKQDTCP